MESSPSTRYPTTLRIGLQSDDRHPRHHKSAGSTTTLFAAYFQDDVRLRSNLSANLGLRYETTTVPTETAGRLSALQNTADSTPHLGSPYFANPTKTNFEPRLGVAWDTFGDGRFLVRSGSVSSMFFPFPISSNSFRWVSHLFLKTLLPTICRRFPFRWALSNSRKIRRLYVMPTLSNTLAETTSRSGTSTWKCNLQGQVPFCWAMSVPEGFTKRFEQTTLTWFCRR
jgi:hypothetical protein